MSAGWVPDEYSVSNSSALSLSAIGEFTSMLIENFDSATRTPHPAQWNAGGENVWQQTTLFFEKYTNINFNTVQL